MIRALCHAALICCLGIAACAVQPAVADVTMITVPGRHQTICAGQSSKADVILALGNTKILRFDSGFEVWVYHLEDDGAELIVLFAPSGVVAKTRVLAKPMAP